MPQLSNYIVCFDFETTGLDTGTCEPLEVGAIVIDQNYNILPDKFISDMGVDIPFESIDKKALEVNGFTRERIEKAPPQEHVWREFCKFVGKYNVKGGNPYPIAMGANIKDYDLPIAYRLCSKYGMVDTNKKPKLFNKKRIYDIYEIICPWMDGNEELQTYRMDDMRDYFGLSREKSHTALKDCYDTARICCRFLKMTRALSKTKQFKGAFANEKVDFVY